MRRRQNQSHECLVQAAEVNPAPRPEYPELSFTCTSLAAWTSFAQENAYLFEHAYIEACVHSGLTSGLDSNFLGQIPADKVSLAGENIRESFLGRGFTPRQRLLFDLIYDITGHDDDRAHRIYAHEALSNFALTLRGRYPRFLGSEFTTDEARKSDLFPIPVIDIAASPFEDQSFDLVVSGDVLEHVSDLPAALSETQRILAPGGQLLATFPFHHRRDDIDCLADVVDGKIRHLREPEYHGNPADPENGSLVFQIPSWQILDDVRSAGFRRAEMVFTSSPRRGIIGTDVAGIFVLRAVC